MRLLAVGLVLLAAAARAEDSPHARALPERDVFSGDWGRERSALEDAGYRLSLNLTAETFADVAGGDRSGVIAEELVETAFDADLQKALGWGGALLHINGYLTNGRGLSTHNLAANLMTVSNIEADRGGRLFDLWLQQSFLQGRMSLRIGQLAAAEEFFVSGNAALFVNGTYGWPAVMSSDLPGGGPTYPLATPGARLAYAFTDSWSLAAGITNGDPSGPGPGMPLARDPSGTNFRLDGGAFAVAELVYRRDDNSFKLGAWHHGDRFPGLGPAPRAFTGNSGVYGVADVSLAENLSGFLRLAAAPGERNLVSAYGDGGLIWRNGGDSVGIAFAYAGIGGASKDTDRAQAVSDPLHPIRSFEGDMELTWQTSLTPWFILQPDLQLVLNPGGHAPASTARAQPGALVLGLRSVVIF